MQFLIKMIIKIILAVILLLAVVLCGLIIHGSLTVYKPNEKEIITTENKGKPKVVPNELSLLIWNVGYCGLGKEMDFFYDGGKTVYGSRNLIENYFAQNKAYLTKHTNTDFVLLQEVDRNSWRSHKINQYKAFNELLNNHTAAFATNYKVQFLPYPFNKPLGKIWSGLASYSKYQPIESMRYQFPGSYAWPKANYLLKRCFLLQRFTTQNQKELVVINTHNSAYDSGGSLKKEEMAYLKNVLLQEYDKGNYIIVGGDWNQIPFNFNSNTFKKTEDSYHQIPVPKNYLPNNWQWVYDAAMPTNRKLAAPYQPAYTFTTIIDFYLLSPNIKVLAVKTDSLAFESSDHQPVNLKIKLN